MPVLTVQLNPLMFSAIEAASNGSPVPTVDEILEYLLSPDVTRTRDGFAVRYNEISAPDDLPVAPNEPTILEKLVWPLRHAKGSYALGNFLGCIALCGVVSEMVAVLLWDISKVRLGSDIMTEQKQADLFASSFEKLGQDRRTKVLHAFKLIDDEAKVAFDELRILRRRYLHLLSQTHEEISSDARRAYAATVRLVKVVLPPSFQNGILMLRPDLMAYLVEKGLASKERKVPETT